MCPDGDGLQEVVGDKEYHSNQALVDLEAVGVRSYISEPDRGRRHWKKKPEARTHPMKRATGCTVHPDNPCHRRQSPAWPVSTQLPPPRWRRVVHPDPAAISPLPRPRSTRLTCPPVSTAKCKRFTIPSDCSQRTPRENADPLINPIVLFDPGVSSSRTPGLAPGSTGTILGGGTIQIGGLTFTSKPEALPELPVGTEGLFLLRRIDDKYQPVGRFFGAFEIADGHLKRPFTTKENFADEYRGAPASATAQSWVAAVAQHYKERK